MRRRTRALFVTAGVTAAGLIAAGVVSAQAASARTAHTLTAREKFTKTFMQDVGDKGVCIGFGDCVLLSGTSDSDGQYNCLQTYHLAGGDFTTSGFFDFAQKVNKWAIIGGTGRYRAASGEADFTTLSADSFADTFRFR